MSNVMKIRPVGAEFFHADGRTNRDRQTDMMKQTVAFHSCANAPKNGNKGWGRAGHFFSS